MTRVEKKPPSSEGMIKTFLSTINFNMHRDFIDFYHTCNGMEIETEDNYIIIWGINDLIELNKGYNVDLYASRFFIFGTDGGDTAYAFDKENGEIYEMPFIGMSEEEAIYLNKTFNEFLISVIGVM